MGIFNQAHLALRRASAAPEQASFLYDWIDVSLKERLDVVKRDFSHGVILSPQSDIFLKSVPSVNVMTTHTMGDVPPDSFDIVLSVLDLHAVEDVPGYLSKVRQLLMPDGLFLAVFYGGDTLIELRHACQKADLDVYGGVSPRVHPMIALSDFAGLMQGAGFQMPVIDHEKKNILYDAPDKAWRDLTALGETNALVHRCKGLTTQAYFDKIADHYPVRDGDDYVATVDIIFASGWAPGPDQPRPLKPGSAQQVFGEVL